MSGGITAKLCYFLFVDDGLSRSFLTIFPPPQSSEGNIDVKKKIRSGVSLKEEDLAGITGWIGWVLGGWLGWFFSVVGYMYRCVFEGAQPKKTHLFSFWCWFLVE